MAYKWSNELETGQVQIDNEHKELFKAINNLLEACSSGKGRGEVENTIKFLTSYTKTHFAHEEALQKKYGYPDYINHKKYHQSFIKIVEEIQKELLKTGPNIVILGEVNNKVGSWLIKHIKVEDVKVANYIKNK